MYKKFLVAALIFLTSSTVQAAQSDFHGYTFNGQSIVNQNKTSIKLKKGESLIKTCDDGTIVSVTANIDNSGTVIVNNDGSITLKPTSDNAMNAVLNFNTVIHTYKKIDGTLTISNNKVLFGKNTKVAGHVLVLGTERPFHYESIGGTGSLELSAISNRIVSNKNTNLTGEVNKAGTLIFTGEGSAFIQVDAGRTFHNAFLTEGITLTSAADEYHFVLEKIGTYNLNGMKIETTKENTVVFLINHNTISFKADAGIICNGSRFDGDNSINITTDGKSIRMIAVSK